MDRDVDYPLHATTKIAENSGTSSKSLRILRSIRNITRQQDEMQVFNIVSQVHEQLASAKNLENLFEILVGIVKQLTSFHHVMIYQFDSFFNGRVVAEHADTKQTPYLYKGSHFPASDVPHGARDSASLGENSQEKTPRRPGRYFAEETIASFHSLQANSVPF
jgi:light-regulated signal transduction histidine kinase (bacteriophytochrome)